MLPLTKILLPVDFSERALGAARCVKALARCFQSEITLLHVVTPPHYEFGALEVGGSMLSELFASRTAQIEKELAEFCSEELQGLRVKRLVIEGDPARRIVEHAHAEKVDLIVMPTHGYGPFRRFILGSVTAKVLHDADCPVWTGVHMAETPSREGPHLGTVICAVDLHEQSARVVNWAAKFAASVGARLIVLHATATLELAEGEYSDPAWRTALEKQARQEISGLLASAGAQAEIQVEIGDPAEVVRATAEGRQGDLVVIGRGSAAGVFGRLRTNAYAIIRESPCPVVSV